MNDKLDRLLAEVRKEHRRTDAPVAMEGRLRAAARREHKIPVFGRPLWAIAAVLLISVMAWQAGRAVPAARSVGRSATIAEVATDFITLPGTESLPAAVQTSVLRVEVRKGDLRPYGFDIPPGVAGELVRADFVVGDDGLARAVRLVQ
jgi:hypothetical protein